MSEIKHLLALGAKVKDLREEMHVAKNQDYNARIADLTVQYQGHEDAAAAKNTEKFAAMDAAYGDQTTGEIVTQQAMFTTKNAELEGKFAAGGSDAVTTGVAISDKGTELSTLFAQRESEILADISAQAAAEGEPSAFEAAMLAAYNA